MSFQIMEKRRNSPARLIFQGNAATAQVVVVMNDGTIADLILPTDELVEMCEALVAYDLYDMKRGGGLDSA